MPEPKIAVVCGCPFCTHTRNVIRWTLCFAAEESKRLGHADLDKRFTEVSEDWNTIEQMKRESLDVINDPETPTMDTDPTDGHVN